ncbi:SDR family NAD(P)-dependent oxidoreductase [Labedaea rhizosphaerae]|uniref:Phosphopantetheine binding protein n=1 Tax=Labedaea rhizosphaerae TaxID=598644 RepID=A0A4R6SHV5_LABRH|nr:SDR family NAD(P)-dependent oxidoreductase [Labedaea rhizosphaerae]TDQ00449.1 phosphopantetheine binding protein [Labedaea rhizosphaerae]
MTEIDTASDAAEIPEAAVALIGMSGRFPGAAGVAELWRNLLAGTKGLRVVTDEELDAAGVPAEQRADPEYVRVGGPLDGIELFDAGVFGFSPREAETMEPQHRMFLECCWEALEIAGYCPTETPGHVGVFGGTAFPHYMVQNARQVAEEPGGEILLGIGNERDSLANLVSYKLGLRGPSVAVQSFCSTSLVAVHLAVQSLLTYECDIALAGGAHIPLPQPTGYHYQQGGILSPDGIVRSFDAEANGTVMGNGVGVVALKRLAEALEDGDLIHAVVLGSAMNNDGRVRAGYTAPGVDGQAEVIETALRVAGVKPESVGYVECHATGTMLGDSIELAAMSRVFQQTPRTPCVLGTLKPSIGHLDRASGVAGLMRAALNLEHELLPGTPGFTAGNPALAAAADRFTVLTEDRSWPRGADPRRAGVSSFGLGGTNVHVVLEEAPRRPAQPPRPGPHLLTFSAADEHALDDLTELLRDHLNDHPDADLADVAFTLQSSRGGFARRRAVVCADVADAVAALADRDRWIDAKTTHRDPLLRLTGPGVTEDLTRSLTRLGVRPADDPEAKVAAEIQVASDDGLLTVLARCWQAGAVLDWAKLHDGAGRRVELPTYPFQRRRYWLEPRAVEQAKPVTGRYPDLAQWTNLPSWAPHPLPRAGLDEQLRAAGPWLVLAAEARGTALIERLRDAGAEVTAVHAGDEFACDALGDFTVRAHEPDDLDELFANLFVAPRTIVHGFSLGGPQDRDLGAPRFESAQEHGLYSALALAGLLVDDSGTAAGVELVLLTSGATGVLGPDLVHPEHATLAALAPTLAQENFRLRTRHIDVDPNGGDRQLDRQLDAVLAAAVCRHEGPVAERAGGTWLRRYEPHPLPAAAEANPPFRDGDTVLITGGLGDVGLVLARHLAESYGCRLVLTARSPLPDRSEWPAYLDAVPAGGERTARHIRNVLDLEAKGATVFAASADVADAEQMRAVVAEALARFGRIDVVVHAAGVQDSAFFGFAHQMDRTQVRAHLAAKVGGFHVLQDVLDGHCPDRRITLSSLAAVLGGITLGPYAAANAGLDAYTAAARADGGGQWITVDWDTWRVDDDRLDGHGPATQDFTMSPAEGVEVLERALAAGDHLDRLVISTGSLPARLAQWVVGDVTDQEGADDDSRERHPRPDLDVAFEPPAPGTQEALAEIWSSVLGVDPVGAHDNFFELGGHSLVAIKVTNRIRAALGKPVPVSALLDCPTVSTLAALIDEGQEG